ncbi:hypothetical protein [Geobacter sp.]|uniref:hypothetical protein n=1 Tax=Geobacter sp. TaxID=46610 RepID=UPI0027B994EE|nr:hypothetical protein [Geobacter sp.]
MRNKVLLSLMLVVLAGCAADLRSGRKFEGFHPMTYAECEKVLPGKDEGVQVIEALRRTGQLKAAEAK